MDKIKVNLYDLLLCLSNAEDLVSPDFPNHHRRVASLAFRLAQHINLPISQQKEIFMSALVHDIGALSMNEKLEIVDAEPENVNVHAFRGAKLLSEFTPLREAAYIIKFHHIPWNNGEGLMHNGEQVPLASHIIHLADRVCVMINSAKNVLTQIPYILANIKNQKYTKFEPGIVDALLEISCREYIWLDIIHQTPQEMLSYLGALDIVDLDIDDIVDFAHLFSHIIDFRSRFTARHSAGVAKTAERLAELFYFSPYECKMMIISGYLHDLGKLAIDSAVLEKPGRLNDEEYNEMRMHTYHTYHLLDTIPQFRTVNRWASYHHEKMNGKGYPFHIDGDNLTLGSRIMAVADVFSAITEDRPYRTGMEEGQARIVLSNMAVNGSLDRTVVEKLIENFDSINILRRAAQEKASEEYEKFMLD